MSYTHRGQPVKSLPKILYGTRSEAGELPLFRTGKMDKSCWHQITEMPDCLTSVAASIAERFSVPQPNHVWANFYGADSWIPVHQDQPFSQEATGPFEDAQTVFILSVGAQRPLCITTLGCKGAVDRDDMEVVAEVPMAEGSLFRLAPRLNTAYGHGIPKTAEPGGLRVSFVFRCVQKAVVHPEERYWREVKKGKAGKRQPL